MNSTYLRIIDLSSLAESLDTFCPLYLIMKSPFCNPADAAGEPVKNGVRDSHLRRMAIRNLTRSTDIGTTIHLLALYRQDLWLKQTKLVTDSFSDNCFEWSKYHDLPLSTLEIKAGDNPSRLNPKPVGPLFITACK